MRIKAHLVATIVLATALIGAVGGVAIYVESKLTRSVAVTEATSVARQLGLSITFKAPDAQAPLLRRPEALQAFVAAHHRGSNRDFVVVDRDRVILADIPDEKSNVGTVFNHDAGGEVAKTITDGLPRSFVERSADVAGRANLVVVPIGEHAGSYDGAVIFEYTSLLRDAERSVNDFLWLIGFTACVGVIIAALSAAVLLRRFNAGLRRLTEGIRSLASGRSGTRIEPISADEFGDLAKGFNAMAGDLETSRAALVEQKTFVEDIVHTAAEGIAVIDGQGRVGMVNPAAARMLGRRADRIAGQDWRAVVDMRSHANTGLPEGASPVEMAIATGQRHQGELRLMRPDGSHLPIIASCSPLSRPDAGVVLTFSDISALHQAERSVNERAEELAALNRELRANSEATARLVKLGELLQACVTYDEAFAVVGAAMPGFFPALSGNLHLTSASRNLVEEMAQWGARRSSAAHFAPEDCWALRRGQEHVFATGRLTPRCSHVADDGVAAYVCMPLAAQGETLGILHMCRSDGADTTDWLDEQGQILRGVADTIALALANLRLRETLRQQSIRDPSTGLFNRRYLEETGGRELRRMQRSGQPLVVIMLDVDHFKRFNDSFGHDAGDLVLMHVASVLLDHAQDSDIASRYGGEEFALILPGTSLTDGIARADQLRQAVKQIHLTHRSRRLGSVSISVGVAASPQDGASWSDLVRSADRALYQAKADGRDRVVSSAEIVAAGPGLESESGWAT